jgi:hypothetical protein
MRYKILHIPTGEIYQVVGAHSKSLEKFKKEFKICLEYAVAPVTPTRSITWLQKRVKRKLSKLDLHYCGKYNRKNFPNRFWLFKFTDFAAKYSLGVTDTFDVIGEEWTDISASEFEVLE